MYVESPKSMEVQNDKLSHSLFFTTSAPVINCSLTAKSSKHITNVEALSSEKSSRQDQH